ncbi:hypothetical protein F4827_003118 [Paraburkholderia bannensis]|uniref:Uncharacterized protein n=1 Tax=Paraburkholderia bannensis TaxID=765414 RepID=A0A7W9TXI1_9BURK|nr:MULTISPECIES: hypothetical protein [Paraburkholderia]MBB3258250.1 hypothetical protein [Paraburkholderia sp. WP4_3_2]MBB6103263.1 hypothetical protein [Paraburkholderia bannensis]
MPVKTEFIEASSARPELLCYLVAIAASSYALTQEWRVDHVVSCCREWLDKAGATMHWLDRVRLGQLALKIASRDLLGAGIAVRLSSVSALFTSDMELNEASTMVQRMMSLCQANLHPDFSLKT